MHAFRVSREASTMSSTENEQLNPSSLILVSKPAFLVCYDLTYGAVTANINTGFGMELRWHVALFCLVQNLRAPPRIPPALR